MTKSQKIAHMTAMLRKKCDDNIHECADILQGMAIAIFGYYAGQLDEKEAKEFLDPGFDLMRTSTEVTAHQVRFNRDDARQNEE